MTLEAVQACTRAARDTAGDFLATRQAGGKRIKNRSIILTYLEEKKESALSGSMRKAVAVFYHVTFLLNAFNQYELNLEMI
jgi:hypothetical protein